MTMMTVWARCPLCGTVTGVEVPESGFGAWKAGALIQNALPTLSPVERELLMSGVCTECWESLDDE